MTVPGDGAWEDQAQARIAQLEAALESRSVIARAQGILMERFGVDDEAAISVLKRASSTLHIPLRAVASQLVETRELPPGFVGTDPRRRDRG